MKLSIWRETMLTSMKSLWAEIAGFIPNLIAAIVLIVVGIFAAKACRYVLARVFEKLGVNKLSTQIGLQQQLDQSTVPSKLSDLLAISAQWIILLAFLIAATEILGLDRVSASINQVMLFLPKVIGAGLVLIFGFFLAGLAKRFVQSSLLSDYVEYRKVISGLLQSLIIVVTVSIAFSQLEFETQLLNYVVAILIGAISIGIAVSLMFGTRDLTRSMMAGVYIRELYKPGDTVRIDNIEGRVITIGSIKTSIDSDGEVHTVPNYLLSEKTVSIISK